MMWRPGCDRGVARGQEMGVLVGMNSDGIAGPMGRWRVNCRRGS